MITGKLNNIDEKFRRKVTNHNLKIIGCNALLNFVDDEIERFEKIIKKLDKERIQINKNHTQLKKEYLKITKKRNGKK